jgi:hypothetical protein
MGSFLEIFSGKLLRFRTASKADVDAGTSDKLIVTPFSLAKSTAMSNVGFPLVVPSPWSCSATTFSYGSNPFVMPANGFFFPNRQTTIQAQLFIYGITDLITTGEICIVDAITNVAVANSTLTFNNNAWGCTGGAVFQLEAGKVYNIALRKSLGLLFNTVQVKAATITFKLLTA